MRSLLSAIVVAVAVSMRVVAPAVVPALQFELVAGDAAGCAGASVAPDFAGLYLHSLDEDGELIYYEYTEPIDPNSEWKTPSAVNKARHRLRLASASASGAWTLTLEVLKHPVRWEMLAQTTFRAQSPGEYTTDNSHAALGGLLDSLNDKKLPTSQCKNGAGDTCQWTLHPGTDRLAGGGVDESCFDGVYTAARCCSSPFGDSACWGGEYTFARCCGSSVQPPASSCTFPVQAGSITAAPADALHESHSVNELPGWSQPLPMEIFAGSVPVVDTGYGRKFVHYMLAQAETQPTSPPIAPDQVPVVLWLQGGPGCSAMSGMWTEVGPFQMRDGSNDTLQRNPYSWTRFAHVLAIDAPIGVGWSSSEMEAGATDHTDESTALLSWKFLQRWFSAFFPQLKDNPFFLAGESYAGVFVPTLAEQIVDAHAAGDDSLTEINLRGIVVGNGCAGSATGLCGIDPANDDFTQDFTGRQLQLLYGRGLISSTVHANILGQCNNHANGFPKGYALTHGLPACIGVTKQQLCGLQATDYFRSFLQWLIKIEAGEGHLSQMIPDCLGSIPEAVVQSQTTMAALDAMEIPSDLFGPLPPGAQAQLLLQLNDQIWPTLFSQLKEQDSDFLAQYLLTEATTYLIGAQGATPAWRGDDITDPLGRTINIDCCVSLREMTATVGLIDVYDTSDQQCKGGPLPSGTWHEAVVKQAATTISYLQGYRQNVWAERIVNEQMGDVIRTTAQTAEETISAPRYDLDPCGGSFENLMDYFNSAPVVAALHAPFGRSDGVHGWGICTSFGETHGNYSYTKTVGVAPYGKLLGSINVSIYSGDTDACVPFSATVGYFSGLASQLSLVSDEEWLPWLVAGQVGGYVTSWHDDVVGSRLSVSTVRGAGHMVPSLRPKQALALLYRAVHQIGWGDEAPLAPFFESGPIDADSNTLKIQITTAVGGAFASFSSQYPGVAVGHDVRFEVCFGHSSVTGCEALPIAVPLVFRWSHSGREIAETRASERLSGAADAVLLISAVKPGDAGDYTVEVWDVLGNSIGSTTVTMHVNFDKACVSDTAPCQVGGGCPASWQGDGECDRSLCPHGDLHDCDLSSTGDGEGCSSYLEFSHTLNAISEACCDHGNDDCSTGFPIVCDARCAIVLKPAISACTTFLSGSTPEVVGINGADVLIQLQKAAERCDSTSKRR
jgi:hypothetical protein